MADSLSRVSKFKQSKNGFGLWPKRWVVPHITQRRRAAWKYIECQENLGLRFAETERTVPRVPATYFEAGDLKRVRDRWWGPERA